MRMRLVLFALAIAACHGWSDDRAGPTPASEIPLTRFDPAGFDPSVDPCTDFYQYACGRWIAANPIPADRSHWSTVSNLKQWNQSVLREALEHAASARQTPAERQLGDYWAACMDEAGVEAAGLAALAPELRRIDGIASKAALATAVARLHLASATSVAGNDSGTPAAMLGFGPAQDYADSRQVVAAVDQGGLALPGRDYYLSDDPRLRAQRKRYLEHVRTMLGLAGEPADRAAADAGAVLAIETALAAAATDAIARRDPQRANNVRTLAELAAATPSFDWTAYLAAIEAPMPRHFLVSSPDFLAGLERLLVAEPLEHWKAYLRWWAIHAAAEALPRAFVAEHFEMFGRTLTGARELAPRWRRCVGYADRDLGEALGQAYVTRAFPADSKQRVEQLVASLERALADRIERLDWMSGETRHEARKKLAALGENIGYPARFRDYAGVAISRSDLLDNMRHAAAFEVHRQLATIGRPVDRSEWEETPPTISAYYNPRHHTINFPAGILQPPLFDRGADPAVNYGAIGVVIGHEIVHGFDDQGRKLDGDGNLRDWWTVPDAQRYEERTACIARQYTQELPELGVVTDGRRTLGEDTADSGGVHLALLALEGVLAERGRSLDDRGTDGLTAAQRFFLSYAFSWCVAERPEAERRAVRTDPHSLPRLRVNLPLANSVEFARAFRCRPGAPMVQPAACRVW
jgi:endothelin-converting enzyme/putative endopeptidase